MWTYSHPKRFWIDLPEPIPLTEQQKENFKDIRRENKRRFSCVMAKVPFLMAEMPKKGF